MSEKNWGGDIFDRKPYADFLTTLLSNKDNSFVLNINAKWGAGKTFFLSNWHDDIQSTHLTSYFNAWKNDYADDPLIAVIATIKRDLLSLKNEDNADIGKKIGSVITAVAPIVVKGIVSKLIGSGGLEQLQGISSEDEKFLSDFSSKTTERLLSVFAETEGSVTRFKTELGVLIKDISEKSGLAMPMFIFVDELDRCRPSFAIETLERIKHLFDIPEIVFVIATDTEQLSHSIKAIYGEGFNGRTYLRRFFDQEYALPEPDNLKYAEMLFSTLELGESIRLFQYSINFCQKHEMDEYTITTENSSKNAELVILFTLFSGFFELDLRTQKQCFDKFQAITLTIDHDEELHAAYVIFLIMLESKEPLLFDDFFVQRGNILFHDKMEQFATSSANICISSTKVTARELLKVYVEYVFTSSDQFHTIINALDPHGWKYNICASVINRVQKLQSYKAKVELVGALS